MKKILSTTLLCSVLMLWAGCGSGGKDDSNKSEQTEEQAFATDGDLEYTELQKAPMPCSKDDLSAAWKRIGVIELQRKKTLDYSQHSPTLFFPTDLDEDGNPEVLVRSEPPYAAVSSASWRIRSASSPSSTRQRWASPSPPTASYSATA